MERILGAEEERQIRPARSDRAGAERGGARIRRRRERWE